MTRFVDRVRPILLTVPFYMVPGIQQLRDVLGISKVYDLRSDTEMHKYDTPIPVMEGVEVVHVPVFKKEDYSPEAMAKCVWPSNDLPHAQT